jgi:TolA-binding protein
VTQRRSLTFRASRIAPHALARRLIRNSPEGGGGNFGEVGSRFTSRVSALLIAVAVVWPVGAFAGDEFGGDPGAFLRLGQGARLKAMGGAGLALLGEPWQLVVNPCATAYSLGKGALATHGLLFMDTDFQALNYLHPIWGWGTVAGGILTLRSTGFERRGSGDDDYTTPGPEFDVRQSALAIGMSRELSIWGVSAGAGVGVKVIQESVDNEQGTGAYVDFSATYRPVLPYFHPYMTPLSLTMTASNLVGSAIKVGTSAVDYPAAVTLGAAYRVRPLRLIAVSDVEWVDGGATQWRAGCEAWPVDELALRVGRGGQEWTGGIGVVYKAFHLDYAFAWHKYLEDTHRVSLGVWLDSPFDARSLAAGARKQERMGLIDDAADRRLRLVCAHPWDADAPEAAYGAAQALAAKGRNGGARQLSRFLLGEHYPTLWAAKALLWLGDQAFQRERFREAVHRYEELLDHPHGSELDSWQVRFKLGSSHDRLEHWERAVTEYRQVLELAPEGSERKTSLWRAADILFDPLERYGEALPLFEEIVRKYPDDDLRDPYFRLGICGFYIEEWQKALQAFLAFLERYPNEPRLAEAGYRAGRCLYELRRYREALTRLEGVVSVYPGSEYADDALVYIGAAREALDDYQTALVSFGRVLKDYPDGDAAADAMAGIARAYTFLGMADLAEQELQRLFRYYPGSETARRLGAP